MASDEQGFITVVSKKGFNWAAQSQSQLKKQKQATNDLSANSNTVHRHRQCANRYEALFESDDNPSLDSNSSNHDTLPSDNSVHSVDLGQLAPFESTDLAVDDGWVDDSTDFMDQACKFLGILPLSMAQIPRPDIAKDQFDWMLDFGTSHSMTPYSSVFETYQNCWRKISVANGDTIFTKGFGDIGKGYSIPLSIVWHVPDLPSNLISVTSKAILSLWELTKPLFTQLTPYYLPLPVFFAKYTGSVRPLRALNCLLHTEQYITLWFKMSSARSLQISVGVTYGIMLTSRSLLEFGISLLLTLIISPLDRSHSYLALNLISPTPIVAGHMTCS